MSGGNHERNIFIQQDENKSCIFRKKKFLFIIQSKLSSAGSQEMQSFWLHKTGGCGMEDQVCIKTY
jgi:hypothetical protein